MKFRIDAVQAEEIRGWARQTMVADPFGYFDGGDHYHIHSLYFDTPALDLFRRTGRVGRTKMRLRRYGDDDTLWFESKRKRRGVVRKRRTPIDRTTLNRYRAIETTSGTTTDTSIEPGKWFLDRLNRLGMEPTVRLSYQRFARMMDAAGPPCRLTIDRQMTASPSRQWDVDTDTSVAGTEFGKNQILELKFNDHLPSILRQLLRLFSIQPTGFSKYQCATATVVSRATDPEWMATHPSSTSSPVSTTPAFGS